MPHRGAAPQAANLKATLLEWEVYSPTPVNPVFYKLGLQPLTDIMGPLPESDRGNKYIMDMVDQFSNWVEIQLLPEISAETMAQMAIDHFFSRFGYALQIHTDQGKNFDGNLFKAMCDLV